MKKISCLLLVASLFLACTNQENTGDSTTGPNTTNVQNVNGNQPDTMGGITLDKSGSSDTSGKDSIRR